MDKEKQRIKIAEALGLFRLAPLKRTNRNGKDNPLGVRLWCCIEDYGGAKEYADLPDYLNDLNAMHEALKFIGEIKGIDLCWHLNDMGISGEWEILTATAEELAEAFLKTLNLWEE